WIMRAGCAIVCHSPNLGKSASRFRPDPTHEPSPSGPPVVVLDCLAAPALAPPGLATAARAAPGRCCTEGHPHGALQLLPAAPPRGRSHQRRRRVVLQRQTPPGLAQGALNAALRYPAAGSFGRRGNCPAE